MKNIFRLSVLIILALFSVTCKKDKTLPPSAVTKSVTGITNTSAVLNGTVNANYGSATVSFDYGLTDSYTEQIQLDRIVDGYLSESVTMNLTGLTSGVTYHYRVRAVNEKGTTYGDDMTFTTSIIDFDGNLYNAVIIGDQTWMTENLKVTKFKQGTSVPLVTDNTAWTNLSTPGYCWYNNDEANKENYGALYNWYAIITGNLCPDGWHVPSFDEWSALDYYLVTNGYNYDGTTSGNKLAKALASASGWESNLNPGAVGNTDYPSKRNASGFTALPGGCRTGDDGSFFNIGYTGEFWSITEFPADPTFVYFLLINYQNPDDSYQAFSKEFGFSVRCLRD